MLDILRETLINGAIGTFGACVALFIFNLVRA